ncbi:MAG: nitrogen fixation protein NifZ [Gammaproteobacteria bacterium]|nr:nitrogen fixation protein NifZ [Gammaproteobacteria bacterium]MCP5423726.1 nitrogen fixation protein NifZ [Gammaproteobacteria bacterium]MCP5459692.1 nitrogen fixation protein NifZ [Gammaproteobacteria bacterium]
MQPRFEYGDAVRVIRNIRDDGTYPGLSRGHLLVRRGSIGHVRDIGTFLQDQIIYVVHFLGENQRVVGCRETELIAADDPWVPNRFEFHEWVYARMDLAIDGKIVVSSGDQGQVEKIFRDSPAGVTYQVRFVEQILLVPEKALEAVNDQSLPEE